MMSFHSSIKAILTTAVAAVLLSSCCDIYDDLSSCPHGLVLRLSSLNPCGTAESLEQMKFAEVQIYDEAKKLVSTYPLKDLKLKEKNEFYIPFDQKGKYTIAVWGMQSREAYAKTQTAAMAYTKANEVQTADIAQLYYGRLLNYQKSDPEKNGFKLDTLALNVLPYNYDIHFTFYGLNSEKEYSVELRDNNAAYDMMGEIVPTPILYQRTTVHKEDGSFQAEMETLKLLRNGATHIQLKDKAGELIFEAPLESLLRTIEQANGVSINLECTHHLEIALRPIDETFTSFTIWINQWNAVYRRVILGA